MDPGLISPIQLIYREWVRKLGYNEWDKMDSKDN